MVAEGCWRAGIRWTARVGILAVLGCGGAAKASGPDETVLDATALIQLQTRAEHADPREQCYLYTELLHGFTELAGRQLAAGEDAAETVKRMDEVAAKVQKMTAKDAKRLQKAEELMQHIERRVSDMARVASGDERTVMQSTLTHLTQVHSSLLAMVFRQ